MGGDVWEVVVMIDTGCVMIEQKVHEKVQERVYERVYGGGCMGSCCYDRHRVCYDRTEGA